MIRTADLELNPRKLRRGLQLTGDTALSLRFTRAVQPSFDAVARHPYFAAFARDLTLAQLHKGMLGFYPTVEAFPRFMAAILSRIEPRAEKRSNEARSWLMRNISVEEKHREWWVDAGEPLGLDEGHYLEHRPSAKMAAQSHFLFEMSHAAPIGEAVAAVNYAVEGATGVWAREMQSSFRTRLESLGLPATGRVVRWLDAHAQYDDIHPIEALEVVKIFCPGEAAMDRAAQAAVRSLDYYAMALDDALEA